MIEEAWVAKQVAGAARFAHRIHRGYVEYDDLFQEGYAYLLEHPELLEEHTRESEWYMGKSVFYAMNKYGLKQRMAKDGTQPDDYFRYTATVVEDLIADALEGGVHLPSSTDTSGDGRGSKSPAHGFEREVMIADISQAFGRLNDKDQAHLREKFVGGDVADEVLALTHEVTPKAIEMRTKRALVRLAKALNGEYSPKEMRRPTTNASAQVRTRRQEGGS